MNGREEMLQAMHRKRIEMGLVDLEDGCPRCGAAMHNSTDRRCTANPNRTVML